MGQSRLARPIMRRRGFLKIAVAGGVGASLGSLGISDRELVLGKGTVVFAGPTAEFRQQEAELKGRYLSV